MCAGAYEKGIIAVADIADRYVFPDGRMILYLDPHLFYDGDLPCEHILRQPVCRDPKIEHASQPVVGLKDRDAVSCLSQLYGACEPCRPSSYDRHFFIPCLRNFRDGYFPLSCFVIGDEPFQGAYCDRLVDLPAPQAIVLAGMAAYAADDAGEGEPFPYEVKGFEEPAFGDEPHIIPRVEVNGAAVDAWRYLPVYHIC